jgi:hypothetical protein
MEDLQTILDRVLAGVGEMVAQRKAETFPSRSCAHGHGDGEDGRSDARLKDDGCCGLPQVHSFTTEPTRPVARVPLAGRPKTSAGDKWDEPSVALELSGGVHDASTAMMQARTGRPITDRDSQK